mgnify:CR=1 FL=1
MEVKGIDVSSYQGGINWEAVKSAGYSFAMLKLGNGSDLKIQDDKLFAYNVKECDRLGIDWGAYLYSYALDIEDAKSEAQHIIRVLKGLTPSYPIALDMEDADKYKENNGFPSNGMLVDICKTVLSTIEDAGYYACLYASKSWLANQLCNAELDRYDKWVAQWHDECTYKGSYGMWQYTDSESVNGIGGHVDADVAYKDYPSIMKFKGINGFQSISAKDYPTETTYQTYTVRKDDSLWAISQKLLGAGSKYPEIKSLNSLASDTIYPGQVLKIPN